MAALDGHIELKGPLGSGGMGEVHRAWDRTLERAVAVKFFLGAAPREAERLLLEGRLQARVDHPHVVRVLDAGELDGRACLVLQLVEGRSLAELAATFSVEQRVELVRQAALGIHAAHLEGVIHRDVKPANILVEQGASPPRALVTDFGLARGDEAGLTRSGLAAGTLGFISPEQLSGGPIGFASDVYGLGATLFAVLAGHPPHALAPAATPTTEEPSDVLRRVLEAKVHLPRAFPRPLARIVAKAMEKSPGARYESADALAADLARFQRGEPVSARPRSLAGRALDWRRRNRALARASSVAAVALVASLGWTEWSARVAATEALEAARLGALGEAMEAELRMEYLSPPHDLRPALKRVREQVEALRPQAARGGGPANHALGKGLELLGDVDGARAAYERAWAKGFRVPAVAEGLGKTLGEQYRQALQRANETLEPQARERRMSTLRAELRDPAIAYLASANSAGWRSGLLRASIALLEGDSAAARARADDVLAVEPGRYEALVLVAETHLQEAGRQVSDGSLDSAVVQADRAAELLLDAARWGRSDPTIARALARARVLRVSALAVQAKLSKEELAAAIDAVAKATALLGEDPTVLRIQGDFLLRQTPHFEAFHLQRQGTDSRAVIDEGLAVLDKAVARAPSDPEVYRAKSWLFSLRAEELSAAGKPAEQALRQRVEAGEEVIRLGGRGTATVKRNIGAGRIRLGMEAWRAGRDPRPEMTRGIALLEEAVEALPGRVPLAMEAAIGHTLVADVLLSMGDDGWPHFERGLEILRGQLATQPGARAAEGFLGQLLSVLATRRVGAGMDPRLESAEAKKLLRKSISEGNVGIEFERQLASLPLVEARWERLSGRDPTPLLEHARRELDGHARRYPSSSGETWQLLGAVELERALWQRKLGISSTLAAQRGLKALEQALKTMAREPNLWILRARLLTLAGEPEEARRSLERTWSVNPFIRKGPDSRLAEAELVAQPR
jgi:serine/threonine-protein kinase